MIQVSGKRALVTGAGIRVGRAIADALVDAGARVAFHYNLSAEGAEAGVARARAQGLTAAALQADLLQDEQARELAARAQAALGGDLDLLVNSAAVFDRVPFEEIQVDLLDRTLGLGFRAPFLLSQAAVPMLRRTRGCIVNLLDIAAERPWVGYAHYCATKAATHMLTLSLAKELAPDVRVNGIEPGAVLLPAGEAGERDARVARIPLKREGSPEDIAEAVLFLWRNAYATGTILAIDGGGRL
jgi:pteridine reductase